ncbi:MAG: hypothetical protein J2P57_19430 [Acidimicrobiaceae bacterium]|nr:hypothetical protein [Acidimicrobiaceae bacterium]
MTTTEFLRLTQVVARNLGLPDARLVVVQHPLGGIDPPEVLERARSVIEDVLALWTGRGSLR